jgi:assimilatory nitrate reductase catalytic subunit
VHYAAAARTRCVLNTGRVRDQWHTMTRTGRVPQLAAHTPEPMVAVNPLDAAALGLAAGALARVETVHGAVLLRVELSHAQRRGEVFVPMHWTPEFVSTGSVAQAVGAECDAISGQPALKATPASIRPVMTRFHGLLLRHGTAPAPAGVHWVRIPVERGEMFRLTGLDPLPVGVALDRFATALLHASATEIVEMRDPAHGVLRRAALRDGVLEACVMLAPTDVALPADAAVTELLGTRVAPQARVRLLSGRSAAPAEGPRVCTCLGISEATIRHACVSNRLRSLTELGDLLGVGTGCGSCVPELEKILHDVRAPAS